MFQVIYPSCSFTIIREFRKFLRIQKVSYQSCIFLESNISIRNTRNLFPFFKNLSHRSVIVAIVIEDIEDMTRRRCSRSRRSCVKCRLQFYSFLTRNRLYSFVFRKFKDIFFVENSSSDIRMRFIIDFIISAAD